MFIIVTEAKKYFGFFTKNFDNNVNVLDRKLNQ